MDEHVKNAFEIAKLYSKQGCTNFCGENQKVLSTDLACDIGKHAVDYTVSHLLVNFKKILGPIFG